MRSGNVVFIIGLLFIVLFDTALFFQLKQYLHSKWKLLLYWLHTLFFVIALAGFQLIVSRLQGPDVYFWIENIIGIIFLFYTPKLIYIIFRTFGWLAGMLNKLAGQIFRTLAWSSALLIFLIILFSITLGRYNYKKETVAIAFDDLPAAFNGYKVVQLSDIHLGSFSKNYPGISRLVKEVNELEPDIIVFTGDMVNNFAVEMTPWIDQLNQLKAKYGKFAITGNHDYGDYSKWPDSDTKQANLNLFYKNMQASGFQMLNNENVPLILNNDTIYLAGVENWGKPPFSRYGHLSSAIRGTDGHFVLLLSHNPSHWSAEIQKHNIPLTLSGHTHAMQMGIKIGNYKWSPAQYLYTEYDGLYRHQNQYLYVSRGQGYLGFPGRIGLRPVITEIILTRSAVY